MNSPAFSPETDTNESMRDCLSPEVTEHAANGHRPPPLAKQGVDAISILDYVGNTPLFKFCSLTRHLNKVEVYAKAEYLNPAGSVKDRPALSMILKGERDGTLTKDKIILDSTSGNTGIAYAMIGAARGYKVRLVMPGNVSPERKAIVKMYGAELVLSDPLKGSDGAIEKARELFAAEPELYFKPDQYNNEANVLAHFNGTGPEIWRQTRGRITHYLATIGTSGTLMGTSRYLKQQNPDIQCIAVEPDSPMHGIEGLKHMASSIQPGIYHPENHDSKIPAPTEEAYDMQERLAREEGIFVGFSAGAAVWASLDLANKLEAQGQEAVIVTILCDRGDRYLHQLSMLND
jgi:cysteine synthase B